MRDASGFLHPLGFSGRQFARQWGSSSVVLRNACVADIDIDQIFVVLRNNES